jgi:hypothetical protein
LDDVFHPRLDGIDCSGEVYLGSFQIAQPGFKFPQIPHELRKVLIRKNNLWTIDYLFVVEFLAPETLSSHVLEFPWAAEPFVQFPAPPIEIDAATGITALLLQDMIYRYPVFKLGMCLLNASEYVLSLVMVDCSPYPLKVPSNQFHGSAPVFPMMGDFYL